MKSETDKEHTQNLAHAVRADAIRGECHELIDALKPAKREYAVRYLRALRGPKK